MALDYQGNVYVWGDSIHGQFGKDDGQQTREISVLDLPKDDKITEIKAKGKNNLVITENGKAYYWSANPSKGPQAFKPTELSFPAKIHITTASCGYNFAVLVAKSGLVFSFGRDNQAGQLGHGDKKSRETPTLVESLKNEGELIVSVSCGFKHVVCKSNLGIVYTWGWGGKGQLGHGVFEDEYKPKIVVLSTSSFKAKVLQVQSGYSHSMLILDNRKLIWWGTNATIEYEPSPIEVNLYKKVYYMNV